MPDPADTTPPNVPTMVIRLDPKPDDKKSPAKLSYDDMVSKWTARGYPKAAAQGIADNMMRESGGDPSVIGDQGTSRGLFQEHATRKADLEAFAKKAGKSADDPDVQIDFADQELRTKFPTLHAQLLKGDDRGAAEDSFKRVFERPASVMWANNPRLASDKVQFSDYAMKEHDGRKNTDLVYMAPADYLDLSPDLDGKPFANPSGRALKASVDRGEQIEAIPTLDTRVDGSTATVTDQDGRHRALLAQQEGVDAIPVAIRQKGQGAPTEIVGMTGAVLPHDFTKVADAPKPAPRPAAGGDGPAPSSEPIALQAPAQPEQRSLLGQIGDAIMPKAEAAEPANPYAGLAEPEPEAPAQQAGGAGGNPYAGLAEPEAPAAHDGMLLSALKGAGAGFGRTVLAGQELVGKGLDAVGATAPGDWLVNDARRGIANLGQEIAPDQAAHPIATTVGDIAGSAALPGGIAGRVAGNALKVGAISGGLSGLLSPGNQDHYWLDKGLQVGGGAALGAAGNALADRLASYVGKQIRPIYEFVQKVTGQDIAKNPGALAVVKRMERDAKVGGPTAQDMIDVANALPDKPLTIADLGGPEVAGLTGRIARNPGEARAKLTNFLNERDRGAGTRLGQDVDKGLGSGSSYDIADALKQSRAAAAKPFYQAAYAHPAINPDEMAPTGKIGDLLNRPSVQAGLANARKIAAEEGVDLKTQGVDLDAEGNPKLVGVPTWQALDYVKRGIDNVVEQYRDKTTGRLVLDTYGRAAEQTRNEFRQALRDLNPEYRKALDAYSGPSTSLDALHAGENFLSQRPEEIARRLGSYGSGDREFYKLGAADTLRARLAKKAMSADESKALLNSQYMRDQLRPLFDSDDAYHRFLSSVLAERRMFETRFNALGGSQTAARTAEDATPELDALGHLARSVAHAKTGNAFGAGANALRAISAWRATRDPQTAVEIGNLLAAPLARPDIQARLNNFHNFLSALPNTQDILRRGQMANIIRGAGPIAAAGLGQIPSMIVRPNGGQ